MLIVLLVHYDKKETIAKATTYKIIFKSAAMIRTAEEPKTTRREFYRNFYHT